MDRTLKELRTPLRGHIKAALPGLLAVCIGWAAATAAEHPFPKDPIASNMAGQKNTRQRLILTGTPSDGKNTTEWPLLITIGSK